MVNGITAWQMLYRKARVTPGQTILVHGANGGVGMVLSQLALHAGIRVIGTAAPRHHEALSSLGVEPVDYNAPNLAARVRAKPCNQPQEDRDQGPCVIENGGGAVADEGAAASEQAVGDPCAFQPEVIEGRVNPSRSDTASPSTTSGPVVSCVQLLSGAGFVRTCRSCSNYCHREQSIPQSLRGSVCRRPAPPCNWLNRVRCAARSCSFPKPVVTVFQRNREMKIALFGATGRTGGLIMERALSAGHEVTVLVRDPSKLQRQEGLRLIKGDARLGSAVADTVQGADVVISALGWGLAAAR
jgi:NAD(P)H-binding